MTDTPPTPTRWRTLRTPEGLRPSPRQAQRDARQYAEAWLQALRDWQTRPGGLLVLGGGSNRNSKRQMTPVVGNWNSTPWGHVFFSEIATPVGWIAESAVATRCNADPLLSRIRAGGGLASLSQPGGGWHQHREQAQAYALAVLTLAVSLGDGNAENALATLESVVD